MNSPDDERRCVHCDSHHASNLCPGVPRREEGREIEAHTLPATVRIDTKTLTQMLYHYNPGCLRKGETVDHVYMSDGEIVIFLKGGASG